PALLGRVLPDRVPRDRALPGRPHPGRPEGHPLPALRLTPAARTAGRGGWPMARRSVARRRRARAGPGTAPPPRRRPRPRTRHGPRTPGPRTTRPRPGRPRATRPDAGRMVLSGRRVPRVDAGTEEVPRPT